MNTAVIENYRYEDEKICKFLDIGIAYGADLDRAMAIMAQEVRAHRDYYDNRTQEEKLRGVPEVVVRVTGLGNNAVNVRAYVWARDAGTGWSMVCDLLYSIKKRFDEAGIELPKVNMQSG
jgi:small-conductance mechanosensitive channel